MKDIKISFTGDIMCQKEQISAHKIGIDKYDFSDMFSSISNYFNQSDYIVGNLETPVAGKGLVYSNEEYAYNTPNEILDALKILGIDLITTANNHCLDRGIEGLKKTIRNIDKHGFKHIGTYVDKDKSIFIENIEGIKIGFLSYTYGTNAFANNNYLSRNERYMVNLFQEQELSNPLTRNCFRNPTKLYARIYNKLYRTIFKKQSKLPIYERKEKSIRCMNQLKKEIKVLKKQGADYIVMCMHMGGQYNEQPTERTIKLVDKLIKYGVDAVIGHHEHVVHKCDISKLNKNIIKTYSLGNFISLAGVTKEPYNKMAEYSIIFNIYLNKENNKTNVSKCSFSITKSISITENKIKTVLLYDLINQCIDENEKRKLIDDNLKIYNLFLNTNLDKIDLKKEYIIG